MDKELTAVITGGNKGIGANLAQTMLDAGYRVISVARRAPELGERAPPVFRAPAEPLWPL